VLCGRFASEGLTSIAIIGSMKIVTRITTGRIKTGQDLGERYSLVIAANRNKISTNADRQLRDIRRDPTRFRLLHFPRLRFLWRLSPFPFAGLLIVAGNIAPNHFVAPFVARYDERNEIAAAKAKRAERHHDDELQLLTHGPFPLKSGNAARSGGRRARIDNAP
jgi:hypothetical protein